MVRSYVQMHYIYLYVCVILSSIAVYTWRCCPLGSRARPIRLVEAATPLFVRDQRVAVQIAPIHPRLHALLLSVPLNAEQFRQTQHGVAVQVQMREHPTHFRLAPQRKLSCKDKDKTR